MSKDNTDNGQSPVFDIENLSWADSKKMAAYGLMLGTAQDTNDIELLDRAFLSLASVLAKCVVSVPSDWLVKDAPKDLVWSDPDSFEYMKVYRVRTLQANLNEFVEDRAKN